MSEIRERIQKSGMDIDTFNSVETLTEKFIEYGINIEARRIDFGFRNLNDAIRGLRTQELMTISAGTGIGKSAMALNLLLNFAKRGELVILFSLEMSEVGIAERIFQIEFDMYGYEVERKIINKEEVFLNRCGELNEKLKNFRVVNKRIDVKQIPEAVKIIEEIKKKKARLICIDYVGLLRNSGFDNNEYYRITDNMTKLYEYAKTLDVAILNLSQVSRLDVKGTGNGLGLYSAKGSGEVENSSDFYLTLERVTETKDTEELNKLAHIKASDENLDLMRLTIHKNRRGKSAIVYLTFNRKNLQIKEYSKMKQEEFEQQYLKN